MHDLRGRTAVITGAASGIGLALAHRFGAEGMNLVIADIERAALDVAEGELRDAGYEVAASEVDVRDLDQIIALEATARERFGNIHLLCNNAGVGGGGPVAGLENLDMWRWTIDVNLWGVIYGCKVFLPGMVEHAEPAHIVNTASMAGLGAGPLMGPYCISKFGVVALSESLAMEMQMGDAAVGVSVLCPEFVQTAIANSRRNQPSELLAAESSIGGSEGFQQMMEAMVAAGMPPTQVADAVHDAVVKDRFWILTHDESAAKVAARADRIVNGINPSFNL